MKCPRCEDREFITKDFEGVNVEYCPQCNGIFLHKGELQKITRPTAGDVEYSSLENADPNRISDLYCPLCPNERMINVNFISYTDIIMKYCQSCNGIWLDKGELDLINKEIDKINLDPENWEHSFRAFLAKLPFN